MSAAVTVRRAVPEDAADLAAIHAACFTHSWSRATFRQELENDQLACYVVAYCEGRAIGYAGLWLVVDEGDITNVAVLPAYRRRGTARQMLQALFDAAEREGMQAVTLEVRAGNLAARRLYEGLGFCAVGRRRRYYEDNGEDAVLMRRESRGDHT